MIECKTKRWGNSIGVLIPRKEIIEMGLREGQEVMVDITKKTNALKDMFGTSRIKTPTRELLREIRRNESKFI